MNPEGNDCSRKRVPARSDGTASHESHQEEGVHDDVEEQGGKRVAGVGIVPDAYLEGDHHGGVEQQQAADGQHDCAYAPIRG